MTLKTSTKETPMMQQYNRFKTQYPGALLLMRVGDFYELFGADAITASKILGITLTKRHNGSSSEIELAGFPHHSLDNYLPKLVRAGQRVAICDQLEDPRFTKKIVKRGVTELVTPGIIYQDNLLEGNQNNYLAALTEDKDRFGLSLLDISTGEFLVCQGSWLTIEKFLQSFNPSEILFSKPKRQIIQDKLGDSFNYYFLEEWLFAQEFAFGLLTQHFKTQNLKGFGIESLDLGIGAAGAILHYLSENQYAELKHISTISRLEEDRYVWLDKFTIRNLELLRPQQYEGIALIDVLDQTITAMGARLLKKWLTLPLKEKSRIEERLNIVELFTTDEELLAETIQHLKPIGDLERIISKVAARRVRPREMLHIKKALKEISFLKILLENNSSPLLKKIAQQLNTCQFLYDKIEKELLPEPKNALNEGGLIQTGVDSELDELRDIVINSKQHLDKIRQHAIIETGITSLKIDYNKVYGYYLEVSHANQHKVPKTWIRKQTLTTAERYITEELKIYEDKIVHAEEKIVVIELRLFQELVIQASDFVVPIQLNARVVAMLDCLSTFAQLALKNQYVRPVISENNTLDIKAGRHPVIERQLTAGESYVPNDIYLDNETDQILVITGPNMAGKSALLRQTALIVIMAQMGCFVPADAANIGLVDKIFTRVGASDNVSRGESTFMVEMTETASIMNNLSHKSLVLMDELGRGTSTYDGISIAWAIIEYLHNHPKNPPKTLFATHYHELNELAKQLPRVKNFHVMVKEVQNKIIFLRKLTEGGTEHSFGIHVAQMAGMPQSIVLRSNEMMGELESRRGSKELKDIVKEIPAKNFQLSIFEASDPKTEKIKELLSKIDINTLSPVEALLKLNELKNMLQ